MALLAEIELEKDELLEQREVCRGRTQHVATAHTLQLLYIQLSGHVLCTNLPFFTYWTFYYALKRFLTLQQIHCPASVNC